VQVAQSEEIPASVEVIGNSALKRCWALGEITFHGDAHVKENHGFVECVLLRQVPVPGSVEIIGDLAFFQCTELRRVTFAENSHVRVIDGITICSHPSRVEIPASVKRFGKGAFLRDCSVLELIVFPGTQIKPARRRVSRKAFVVYMDDNDMKQRRRLIHLSTLVPRGLETQVEWR
jgi:hypothetical protein